MAARLQTKRGLKANLPTSGMLVGEQFWTTDRNTLHIADTATTTKPVVPDLASLTVIAPGALDLTNDLVMVFDVSDTAVQAKAMSLSNFRTGIGASTDEKVAAIAGGTSGYLWGTTGLDGVLRAADATISYAKDPGNAFVSLAVGTLDLGTF